MNCLSNKIVWLALMCLLTSTNLRLASAQVRPSFDAVAYFQRLDRNGDGHLDQNERNANANRYLQRLGLDTRRDKLRLKDIKRTVLKDQEADKQRTAQKKQERLNRGLKVPGFGVPIDENSVSGFGSSDNAQEAIEFSEQTFKMVESVLVRYDRNQDSMIDMAERRRGNWGRPDPSQSDLNKDGVLSRDELLLRYHAREVERNNRRRKRRDRQRENRDGEAKNQPTNQDNNRRESERRSAPTRSSNQVSQQDRSAFMKYSKSLIKRYDKDNDNRLSKSEWKEVRRPPAEADQNNDGFVTETEYADALMRAAGAKTGAPAKHSASSSRTGSTPATDMSKFDSNADARVHMHEYATDWDDKKLAEFYKIDKNHDGVITAKEWQAK